MMEDAPASPSHAGNYSMTSTDDTAISPPLSTSSNSIAPPVRNSPEPTYHVHSIAGTTPHFAEYPRSARERQLMQEEMLQEQMIQEAEQDYDFNHNSNSLSDPLTTGHPSDAVMDIHSLEIEDEVEANPKFPVRSAFIAAFLLLVGLTCLIIGLVNLIKGQSSVFAFVLIGSILIIPGFYQSRIIYMAWRRVPGFSFAQLAAYEGS